MESNEEIFGYDLYFQMSVGQKRFVPGWNKILQSVTHSSSVRLEITNNTPSRDTWLKLHRNVDKSDWNLTVLSVENY